MEEEPGCWFLRQHLKGCGVRRPRLMKFADAFLHERGSPCIAGHVHEQRRRQRLWKHDGWNGHNLRNNRRDARLHKGGQQENEGSARRCAQGNHGHLSFGQGMSATEGRQSIPNQGPIGLGIPCGGGLRSSVPQVGSVSTGKLGARLEIGWVHLQHLLYRSLEDSANAT